MRKSILRTIAASILITISCSKDNQPSQPDWDNTGGGGHEEEVLDKPLDGGNIVVAHRGGSTEAGTGFPDNSIASLRYAMSLKCYASECDIYWTKDNKVVVAHADSECKINGVHPWEATLTEIRNKGKLSNGEQVPELQDFISEVMKAGSCTRLWLDIKNITSPKTLTDYPINACKRACEIITEMKAQNFVEFICTGNQTVMAKSNEYARAAGVEIGWMGNQPASVYQQKSYTWANLSTTYMSQGGGERTIDEFTKADIAISVFNADDDATMNYYISKAKQMKAICTNYPKKLINKMKK